MISAQMRFILSLNDYAAVGRLTGDAERKPAQRSVHSTVIICCGMNGILRQLGFRRSSSGIYRQRQRRDEFSAAANNRDLMAISLIQTQRQP